MMKRVRIERGAKTDKLLRIYYQNVDTDKFYEWDNTITDAETMKAIDKICGRAMYKGTYRQRAMYEIEIDETEILTVLAQVKVKKALKF